MISRIQIRGRLLITKNTRLYQRRYDPVAEQYLWNLLQAYLNNEHYQKSLSQELQKKSLYISRVKYSPRLRVDIFDTHIISSWTSNKNDWQYMNVELGKEAKAQKIQLQWDFAEAIDFCFLFSPNSKNWYTLKNRKKNTDKNCGAEYPRNSAVLLSS